MICVLVCGHFAVFPNFLVSNDGVCGETIVEGLGTAYTAEHRPAVSVVVQGAAGTNRDWEFNPRHTIQVRHYWYDLFLVPFAMPFSCLELTLGLLNAGNRQMRRSCLCLIERSR